MKTVETTRGIRVADNPAAQISSAFFFFSNTMLLLRAMSNQTFTPGPTPNTVRSADGRILTVLEGWILLPPGDAALTRRVKAAGDHWIVQETKGRKVFSRGVWASAATIERIRAELAAERSTERF